MKQLEQQNSMNLRQSNIAKLDGGEFDVLILGGGINGAVSAAALAAKGVKVALVEKDDFAGLTSSNSSNLAWGGIKYLENQEFFLVNKLCKSRNHLIRSYPSTVKEIRFLATIEKGFRFPSFFVYMGALLYWVIGRFFTQPPHYLTTQQLKRRDDTINTDNAAAGLEYSDCYLYDNDARFVWNFVRGALDHGAVAANYVEALASQRENGYWHTQIKDGISGKAYSLCSKVVINACGPLVDSYNKKTQQQTQHHHLFSKGIHLIVDRVTPKKHILTFFASDGRLFFVIPMGPKTCIGTTDTQVDSEQVSVTDEEREFVLKNANHMLKLDEPLTKDDIIAERCGVRPLAIKGVRGKADWVALSRKHAIDINEEQGYLSIFGGKLTDCINVGEEVVQHIEDMGIAVPYRKQKWYGEPQDSIRDQFLHQSRLMNLDGMTDPSSSEPLTERLWRRYGASALDMLEAIRQDPRNAELLIKSAEYLRCEIEHASRTEMITKLEDFLRRRSKIALVVERETIVNAPGVREACELFFGDDAEAKLQEYIEATAPNQTPLDGG